MLKEYLQTCRRVEDTINGERVRIICHNDDSMRELYDEIDVINHVYQDKLFFRSSQSGH